MGELSAEGQSIRCVRDDRPVLTLTATLDPAAAPAVTAAFGAEAPAGRPRDSRGREVIAAARQRRNGAAVLRWGASP